MGLNRSDGGDWFQPKLPTSSPARDQHDPGRLQERRAEFVQQQLREAEAQMTFRPEVRKTPRWPRSWASFSLL